MNNSCIPYNISIFNPIQFQIIDQNNEIKNIDNCLTSGQDNQNNIKCQYIHKEEIINSLTDENLNLENQIPILKNKYLKKPIIYPENEKTSDTFKLLTNKIKRTNDKYFYQNEETKPIKNIGRKSKDDKEKGEHTKYCEDNIIRKIKTNFLIYIHNKINKSIKNKDFHLLRFNSKISENLKKDYNIKLMNTTFKHLYENTNISTKYRKQIIENIDINKQIIQKIYNEEGDKEIDAINILNMTYKELFNDFIINNLNTFLNDVYEEEKRKNESEDDIVNYIDKIKNLCNNYDKWFADKKGRNKTKRKLS